MNSLFVVLTAFVLGVNPTLLRTRFNMLPSSVACFAVFPGLSTTPVEQSRHCSVNLTAAAAATRCVYVCCATCGTKTTVSVVYIRVVQVQLQTALKGIKLCDCIRLHTSPDVVKTLPSLAAARVHNML